MVATQVLVPSPKAVLMPIRASYSKNVLLTTYTCNIDAKEIVDLGHVCCSALARKGEKRRPPVKIGLRFQWFESCQMPHGY